MEQAEKTAFLRVPYNRIQRWYLFPVWLKNAYRDFLLLILNPFRYKKDYIESKTFYEKRKGGAFFGGQRTDQADSERTERISE